MHNNYRDAKIKDLRDQLRFNQKTKLIEQAAAAEHAAQRNRRRTRLCLRFFVLSESQIIVLIVRVRHNIASADLAHDLRLLIEDLSELADLVGRRNCRTSSYRPRPESPIQRLHQDDQPMARSRAGQSHGCSLEVANASAFSTAASNNSSQKTKPKSNEANDSANCPKTRRAKSLNALVSWSKAVRHWPM